MRFSARTSVLLFSVFTVTSLAQPPQTSQCPAVHIITSRASGEAPGYGIMGALANLLTSKISSSSSEPLDYPAKFPYSESIPIGVKNLRAEIAKITATCPETKIVLLGYSQGAAVTVDTLCGGGGKDVGPDTPGLTVSEGRNVVAAVMMGDPRFVPGTSYDAGTNKLSSGVASRDPYVASCGLFASRMVSYCDTNDARCAKGNDILVHMTYLDRYTEAAVMFVDQHLKLNIPVNVVPL